MRLSPTAARRLALVVLLLCCATTPALGQKVELTPLVGFQSGTSLDVRQGDLEIAAEPTFGLILSIRTRNDGLIEFLYSRQPTSLTLDGGFSSEPLGDLDVHYLQGGGLWEIRDGKSRPFIGLNLGGTFLDPQGTGSGGEWLFSGSLYGGVKIFFSERLGIRLEGRGLMSLTSPGGGFFCGVSGGAVCGFDINGTPLVQVSATAGLIFRL